MKKSFTHTLCYTFSLSLLLSTLNASDVIIEMPKVPDVPKVEAVVPKVILLGDEAYKTNEEIVKEATQEKVVIFSDHVAPQKVEEKDKADKIVEVGDISNGKVTAYLHAPLMDTKTVTKLLSDGGFKVLASYKLDKKGEITSLIFTNDAMIAAASKSLRGFATTLRVTINKQDSLISITNPLYMMRAFMQDEYNEKLAQATLKSLRETFKELKNSDEKLKFRILERYQFMEGMPKYEDMQLISEAPDATLLERATKSKKIVYEIPLSNGSTIIGVKLSDRTSKFVKKIGYQNAGLLPYPVLIEDNKVKILDPKYYIAIMYPMLKMSQFMTIATVPGAINKDIDRIFR